MDELKDRYTEEQLDLLVRDCRDCENCMDLEEHIERCLTIGANLSLGD